METKLRIFSNYIWILVLGGFILLLIVFGLIPTLISTEWGKEASLAYLNKKYPEYSVKIDRLSLHWLGPQILEGIEIRDKGQKQTLTAKSINTDSSIWHLVLGKPDIGLMQIISPQGNLVYLKKESLASLKKFEKSSSGKNESLSSQMCSSLPFSGDLRVENGSLEMESQEMGVVSFQEVQVQVHIPKNSPQLNVTAMGKAEHGNISGKFDLMSEIDLSDPDSPSVSIQSKIIDLPVRAVDQLLAAADPELQGLLVGAIGTSIDLDLTGKGSTQALEISLHAKSPNFNAYFETETEKGMVTLKAPALLDMTFTPEFTAAWVKNFPHFSRIQANKDFRGELKIDSFSVPFSPQGLDFSSMAFQAAMKFTPISIIGQSSMKVSDLQASLATQKWSDSLIFQISSGIQSKSYNGRISGNGEWKDNFASSVFNLNGNEVPLVFIDQMLDTKGLLGSFFGSNFSFDFYGQTGPKKNQVSLQVDSPQSQIPPMTFNLVGENFVLEAPAKITFSPSVLHFNSLFPQFQLEKVDPIQIDLTDFSLPKGSGLEKMNLTASLNISHLLFGKVFYYEEVGINTLVGKVAMHTWDNIQFSLENPNITLSSTAALQDSTIRFTQPVCFSVLLTNELLHRIFSQINKLPLLVAPEWLQFELDPFSFVLGDFNLKDLKIKGRGSIPQLILTTYDNKKAPPLRALNMQFQMDGSLSTAGIELFAAVENSAASHSDFDLKLSASDLILEHGFDFSQAAFKINANSSAFSTQFFETWMGNSGLTAAIGPSIDLHLELLSAPQQGLFSLQGTNSQLKMDIDLILKDNEWQLQHAPATLKLVLNKDAYALLDEHFSLHKKDNPYQLLQSSSINVNLNQLNLPVVGHSSRFPSLSTDWSEFQVKGDCKVDQFSLLDTLTGQAAKMQDFSAYIYKCLPEEPIKVSLSGSTSAAGKPGKMKVEVMLKNVYGEENNVDLSHLVAECDINFQQFPSSLLDAPARLFRMTRSPFYSLFGDVFNATGTAKIQDFSGPISLNLNSPSSRASLVGQLQQGRLTLNEPIYAQLMMSPQLSSLLLKDVNPFSIKAVSAKNPMTLEIPAEGFSVRLHPFIIEEVNLPNGKMELGEIVCHNEGNINIMLNILKSKQAAQENLKLWFAPVDFHIKKGIIDCERTDILVADTYHIATWGEIDLVQQYVDMVLGLTADCLNKAFGIKDLPDTYVLQIPMRGNSNNVKINTTMATAKIAALIAWEQKIFGGTFGGSTGGALLGELLNKFGPLPDINANTPPPKRPFPWEQNSPKKSDPKKADKTTSQNTQPIPKKKNAIKKKDKPLKQIWKIFR